VQSAAATDVDPLNGAQEKLHAGYPDGGHDFPDPVRHAASRWLDLGGSDNQPDVTWDKDLVAWVEIRDPRLFHVDFPRGSRTSTPTG